MSTRDIHIEKLTTGQMRENCYVLVDPASSEALVIDPGDEASYIAEHIESLKAKPIAILATHGHFDHVMGANELQLIYNVPFRMNQKDQFLLDRMSETAEHFLGREILEEPPVLTKSLADHEKIFFGKGELEVYFTPGHTPGSACFYLPSQKILFAGDTIFESGAVGRTDFSYSSREDLATSLATILAFKGDTILSPGHGEDTTVSSEIPYHS